MGLHRLFSTEKYILTATLKFHFLFQLLVYLESLLHLLTVILYSKSGVVLQQRFINKL